MPIVSFPLNNLKKSVQEPVCYSVIEDLLKFLELKVPSKITLVESGDSVNTHGSAYDVHRLNLPLLDAEERLVIEYEYETKLEDLSEVAVHQQQHQLIMADNSLGVEVKNVYIPEDMKLNFKYYFLSKSAAQSFHNEFMVRIAQLRDVYEHVVSYHYPIDKHIFAILQEVFYRRESVRGYGDTFDVYIKKISRANLDLALDSVGNTALLISVEKKGRVVGQYDPKIIEKPQKEDDNYLVSFTYTFTYDKPVMQVIKYPIMVHNQLMPERYTTYTLDIQEPEYLTYRRTLLQYGNEPFEATNAMYAYIDKVGFYRVPVFDEFEPKISLPGSITIATFLCEIGDDNKLLLNLNDTGEIELDPVVLNFIKDSEYPYIGKHYHSLFIIELYRDNYTASTGSLVCSPSLDISSVKELDKRRVHHVRFGLNVELSLLKKEALERFFKNRDMADLYLNNIKRLIYNRLISTDRLLRYGTQISLKPATDFPYSANSANGDTKTKYSFDIFGGLDMATMYFMLTGQPLDFRYPPNYKAIQDFYSKFGKYDLEEYRRDATYQKTVMVTSVAAYRSTDTNLSPS